MLDIKMFKVKIISKIKRLNLKNANNKQYLSFEEKYTFRLLRTAS